jgi:hypothetical protein
MSARQDLTNRQFGRLKVIRDTGKRYKGHVILECLCKCGKTCEVLQDNLGKSANSCGCLKIEENLKDCVEDTRLRSLTAKNRKNKINNSGVKGVAWDSIRGMWVARLTIKGTKVLHKRFANKEDAIEAREEAERLYHAPILEKYIK